MHSLKKKLSKDGQKRIIIGVVIVDILKFEMQYLKAMGNLCETLRCRRVIMKEY